MVVKTLKVRLDEADLRPDRTRRQIRRRNHLRTARRIERLAGVATVPEDRAGELRYPHLREQTVDEPRLLVRRGSDIEEPRPLE